MWKENARETNWIENASVSRSYRVFILVRNHKKRKSTMNSVDDFPLFSKPLAKWWNPFCNENKYLGDGQKKLFGWKERQWKTHRSRWKHCWQRRKKKCKYAMIESQRHFSNQENHNGLKLEERKCHSSIWQAMCKRNEQTNKIGRNSEIWKMTWARKWKQWFIY